MLVRCAAFAELAPFELYALLRLRVDVFVVEQHCPYPELDGRDAEPTARHHWIEEGGQVVACLRVLAEPGGATRVGRIATAPPARGRGLAGHLLRSVLADLPRPVLLHAQAHLTDWYASFGFARDGDDFLEDRIPHTPMVLH